MFCFHFSNLSSSQWESCNKNPGSKLACIRKKSPFPAAFLITHVGSHWLQFNPRPCSDGCFTSWSSRLTQSCWYFLTLCPHPIPLSPASNTQKKGGMFLLWLEKLKALGSEWTWENQWLYFKKLVHHKSTFQICYTGSHWCLFIWGM